jgi:hypothetical protein
MVMRSLAGGLPSLPSAVEVITYGAASPMAPAPFKNPRRLIRPSIFSLMLYLLSDAECCIMFTIRNAFAQQLFDGFGPP